MERAYDVAVIGLGAMGSAALWRLARRGVRAIGLDRFAPGHAKGSSHGESRAIRLSYFEHPSYVPLVRRALELWREIEADSRAKLLHVTGVLEAGRPASALLTGTRASCRLHDLTRDEMTAAQANARFPAFALPAGFEALFQPDGGFLEPEKAIRAMVGAARARGTQALDGTAVRAIEPASRALRIETDDGVVEAAAAIVTSGGWIGELIPELSPLLTLTRQPLAWFAPRDAAACAPGRLPVFMIETDDDFVYGFPDFAGTGVKAASHRKGRALLHPDALAQDGGLEDAAPVAEALSRYVPAAAGALSGLKVCFYTNSPDEDFIVGRAAADPRIVFASACSGHGFKFAPAIGDALADLATRGQTAYDLSRFSPGRRRVASPA